MSKEKEYTNTVFHKFDRLNSFIAISGDYFGIGKLKLSFREYDKKKTAGDKITQSIDISLSIPEAMKLAYRLQKNEIQHDLSTKKKEAKSNGSYPAPGYIHKGGTRKEKAGRSDGNALARLFHIEAGTGNVDIFFKAFSGPGTTEAKGGILPAFKLNEAEQQVTISMSYDEVLEFAGIVEAACQSYFTGMYRLIVTANAEEKKKINSQFHRFDITNGFLEIEGDAFNIDHLRLGFRTYDETKAKGSRCTNNIDIFLEYAESLKLAEIILSGRLQRVLSKNQKDADAKGSYPEPAFKSQGGSYAKTANRADKKDLSRIFFIENSKKASALFKAISGPGHTDTRGLIVPDYKFNAPEQRVMIPMTDDNLLELALTLKAACKAHYTFQTFKMFEDIKSKL
ncbi:MAG: hypothetical protein PHY15_08535 [Eubacteriales bacterium]|nr:hypothetical protein [Eubacteriales bacterium]